jgi:pseudomonalisin
MQRTLVVPRQACAAVCAMVLVTGIFCAGQIQPQNRILQPIDEGQVARMRGNLHPLARAEFDRGRLSASLQLTGVSLNFKPSASQQAALDQLLAQLQDPASPNYHRWLSPEEYADQFGMSEGDLNRITQWLESQGFTDIGVARSRTRISFTGTVAQVEAALHTELHNYAVNGEMHFANATAPALPSAIAGTVLSIGHLNNFRPKPRTHAVSKTHFTSAQSGNHFLSPTDFGTIYDITPLYNAGFDGTGIKIAVVGQTQIDESDIDRFRSLSGLPASPTQMVLVPNTGASVVGDTGDIQESDLDVEWSGGVAKNANIVFVYAGSQGNVFDAVRYSIEQNIAPVIGISYGNCESAFAPSDISTLQSWVTQATTQGQTLSAASGDSGAADCEGSGSTVATTGLAVDVPGSIPQVSSVGGGEFTGDNTTGADAPYWTGASGGTDNINSAQTYIPEMAWNDSPVTGNGSQLAKTLSASGGGMSTLFTKTQAPWQSALTPADGRRDVPDISLSASPAHDGYLVCSQGSCVNGFRLSDGSLTVFGGTSVSAQVFAGILAILNQATQSSGLGPVNQELYTLAGSTPAAFHEISSGSNFVPCTSGTPSSAPVAQRCPTTAPFQIGYSAGPGYDLATGLGSIDVDVLARAWPGFASAPSFTVSGDPVTIASAGGSGTSTVTVSSSSGFNGTVALSCAPPASTAAQISCSFSPTSVVLTSATTSATATLTVTTTAAHAAHTTSAKARSPLGAGWFVAASGTLISGILMIGFPGRRRWIFVSALFTCVFLATAVGCGGGSSSSSNGGSSSGGSGTTPTAATPTFSPAPGAVTSGTNVTLSDTTTGAKIFCTTDGSTPSAASSSVCTTVRIDAATTIKAIASATGFNDSAAATGAYTVSGNPGTPAGAYVVTVTAKSGSVSHSADVTVTVQ